MTTTLTQEDIKKYAAELNKSISELTNDDFINLANRYDGSIVVEQPVIVLGNSETEHKNYIPPTNVPDKVPMLSFKLALYQFGVYNDVNKAVYLDPISEIYWLSAQTAERKDERVIKLALGLGWTPQRVDELFILAGTL